MEATRDERNCGEIVGRKMGNSMDKDLCMKLVFAPNSFSLSMVSCYAPFGSLAIGLLLSSGLRLLLTTSKRGPSAGFRGESASAFSYSVILSLGGGDGRAPLFSPLASIGVSPLVAWFKNVASRTGAPVEDSESPHASPKCGCREFCKSSPRRCPCWEVVGASRVACCEE